MSEEQIYMAPKMFELLRFEGSTVVWTAGVVVVVVVGSGSGVGRRGWRGAGFLSEYLPHRYSLVSAYAFLLWFFFSESNTSVNRHRRPWSNDQWLVCSWPLYYYLFNKCTDQSAYLLRTPILTYYSPVDTSIQRSPLQKHAYSNI